MEQNMDGHHHTEHHAATPQPPAPPSTPVPGHHVHEHVDHIGKFIWGIAFVGIVFVLMGIIITVVTHKHAIDVPLTPPGDPLVAILCYHHIDSPVPTPYSVSTPRFIAQLNALEQAGFSFISLKQLEDYYTKGIEIPTRSAVITFDDGNLNNYTIVYPLLKQRKIPWALFIYPGITTLGHRRLCASWDEVKRMSRDGVIIGCHTLTHPFLTLPPKEVTTPKQYELWLEREIVWSKHRIERRLGIPVEYFAVPFGAFDRIVYNKIKRSGYHLSFNVHGMNNGAGSDPFSLNRFVVMGYHSPQTIVEKALAKPLYFDTLNPKDLARITDAEPTLRFKLKDKDRYDRASIQFGLTFFRGIQMTPQEDTGTFEEQLKLKRQSFYVATVSARDRQGYPYVGNWLFLYNAQLPSYIPSPNPTL